MDILDIKGRLAVAFVESVFRRAGYALSPAGAREVPPHLGRDDLPHFLARREGSAPEGPTWLVGVRYRPRLTHYLLIEHQRGSLSPLAQLKRHWPNLILVFFTDYPELGRSSFQVADLGSWKMGEPPAAIDLFAHAGLDVYRHNVEEHEVLARRILTLFEGADKFRRIG